MKVTAEPTDHFTEVHVKRLRIWDAVTLGGIPAILLVARVVVPERHHAAFEEEAGGALDATGPIKAVESDLTFRRLSTPEELLADITIPEWAASLIPTLLDRDPVDVVNVLEVLHLSFNARLQEILARE